MAKQLIKQHFVYYLLTIVTLIIQFYINMFQSHQNGIMDFFGHVFFLSGATSHAMIGALMPYLIAILTAAITRHRTITAVVHIALATFLNIFLYINSFVYALYRFHINGMVLGMFFGEGSDEIFQFDTWLYVKVTFIILLIVGINILLYKLSKKFYETHNKIYFVPTLIAFVVLTLYSNGVYAYSTVAEKQSVLKSAVHIPYYYPLTATRFMIRMGVVSQSDLLQADFGKQTGFKYPKHDIIQRDSIPKYNIVILGIDSWNYRGLDEETMPNIYNFTQDNMLFTNHLSCSNATRGSIFGMFFGVSSYYWADFEMSGTTPVLLDLMQKEGYQIQTFPSATLTNPNFAKLIFRKVDGLNTDTDGETVYDRDCKLTTDFTHFVDTLNPEKPFFAFLFYDLAHAIQMPTGMTKRFLPSWDYADYMKLDNDMDPTPFWNLYRHTLYAIDSLSGIALNALKSKNLDSNTMIIITGDHGQEFNENHKNYWGHGGNITLPQIRVPLIVHYPDGRKGENNYRTTHYDIPATLCADVLGVENPYTDYGMGINLQDSTFRNWHIVGSKENYAFLVKDNVIIEKRHSGMLEISDYKLDPIENYKINAAELNEAIQKLNMFYEGN